jgi:serine/threonine protein kinase
MAETTVGPLGSHDESGIEIQERIGAGGYSSVYKARLDDDPGQAYAVKILNQRLLTAADRRRFDRECEALGRLSDTEGVLRLHRAWVDAEGWAHLVTELCVANYAERVRTAGKLDPDEVVAVGIDVATVLAKAHRLGVTHGDIKPSNLFLDDNQRLLVGDFGAALLADATVDSVPPFSLRYSAPEVLEEGQAGEAADLYGLGATLHHLATGAPPSRPGSDELDGVPVGLARVIRHLLAIRPERRPGNAEQVVGLLTSLQLNGLEPGRSRSRRLGALAAGVVAAAALAAGLVAWQTGNGPWADETVVGAGDAADGAQSTDTAPEGSALDAGAGDDLGAASASAGQPGQDQSISQLDDLAEAAAGPPLSVQAPGVSAPAGPSQTGNDPTDPTNSNGSGPGSQGTGGPTPTGPTQTTATSASQATTGATQPPVTPAPTTPAPTRPPSTPAPTTPAPTRPPTTPLPTTPAPTRPPTTPVPTTPAPTDPPSECSQVCEDFSNGSAGWADIDTSPQLSIRATDDGFTGSGLLLEPTATGTSGQRYIERSMGMMPDEGISVRIRLRVLEPGGLSYWMNLFEVHDGTGRSWSVTLGSELTDRHLFMLRRSEISTGQSVVSASNSFDHGDWQCVSTQITPNGSVAMSLNVDGILRATIPGPFENATDRLYNVILGSSFFEGDLPTLVIDDFEIGPVGKLRC